MPIEWKDVQKWIGETTSSAVRESKELARKGRIQYDIIGIKHHMSEYLTELGGLVYQLVDRDKNPAIADNDKVKELVARIRELETELERKRREREEKKYV